MTDNEITKALECLCGNGIECVDCAYPVRFEFPACQKQVAKDAITHINRQNAEIDRLNIELKAMRGAANSYKAETEKLNAENKSLITANENLTTDLTSAKADIERLKIAFENSQKATKYWYSKCNELVEEIETAKAEAVKEFAERLTKLYTGENITDDMHCPIGVIKANIDDVKKEMVGENQSEQKPNWKESMMRTFLGGRSDG